MFTLHCFSERCLQLRQQVSRSSGCSMIAAAVSTGSASLCTTWPAIVVAGRIQALERGSHSCPSVVQWSHLHLKGCPGFLVPAPSCVAAYVRAP